MTDFIVIADIGDAIFVAILVIASIAGQIAKASKRKKPGGQPSATPAAQPKTKPSPFGSADDQLRNFLETLATGSQPEARPKPFPVHEPVKQSPRTPPPAPAAQQRPAAIQKPRAKQVAKPAPDPQRVRVVPEKRPEPPPAPRTRRVPEAPAPRAVTPVSAHAMGSSTRPSISKALTNAENLKQAIVLREILGPPLSLRDTKGNTAA